MKSKTEYYTGKIISYVPQEALTGNYNTKLIIDAIEYFERNKIVPLRINIQKKTKLSKTSTSNNLKRLIEDKRVIVRYAKVRTDTNTVLSGVYHLKEFKGKD